MQNFLTALYTCIIHVTCFSHMAAGQNDSSGQLETENSWICYALTRYGEIGKMLQFKMACSLCAAG